MGLSVAELEILLRARDEASRVLAQVDRNTRTLGSNFERFVRPAFLALTAATSALTVMGGFLVRQAMEEEVALARVQNAVRNSGGDWEQLGPRILDTLHALWAFSGFTDSELSASFALLLTVTGNADDALAALRLSIDLARGGGTDLETAVQAVSRALQGSMRGLKQYGIDLEDNAKKQEVFAAISDKYSGAAERWGQTLEGQMTRLQQSIQRATAPLREALLPIISQLTERVQQAEPWLRAFADALAAFLRQNPDVVLFTLATVALSGALAILIPILSALLALLTGPAGLILQIVVAMYALKQVFEESADPLQTVVTILTAFGMAVATIGAVLGLTGAVVVGFVALAVAGAIQIATHWEDVKRVVGGFFDALRGWVQSALGWVGSLIAQLGALLALFGAANSAQRDYERSFQSPPPMGIPQFADGGPVMRTGLALVHAGEYVVPRGGSAAAAAPLVINVNGPVYGIDDMADFVLESVALARRRGAFRGVIGSAIR